MQTNSRPTIGLLLNNLLESYQITLWNGVREAARAHDVNLLCFLGSNLRSPHGFDAQRNSVYALVDSANVDGLIVSNTLGNYIGADELWQFIDSFRPLPCVAIALARAQCPTVLVDNDRGLRELLDHLIETHGYRRLAFIGGPENNEEAQARYRTYVETLVAHNLEVDRRRVVGGDFTYAGGRQAVRILFDERQVVCDAIVAANDEMATGVLDELQARGVHVPEFMAVTGFDDVETATGLLPPLTTVRQPIYTQGWQAVETLLAVRRGAEAPERIVLPAAMVRRQSCGCLPEATRQAFDGFEPCSDAGVPLRERRPVIVAAMAEAGGGRPLADAGRVFDSFAAALECGTAEDFLKTLSSVLYEAARQGANVACWQNALSVLRRHALAWSEQQPAVGAAVDNLIQQARVLIGEVAQNALESRRWRERQRNSRLNDIGRQLLTTFDLEGMVNILAPPQCPQEGLAGLGFTSGSLVLYDSADPYSGWGWLVMAYTEKGPVDLPADARRFPTRQIVPPGVMPADRSYCYVIEPLYFQNEQLGYALFEAGPANGLEYELLREQLSAVIKGTLLVQQVTERKREAEQANQAKSEFLSRMSHELRTPLNSILGFAQLLEMDGPLPRQAERLQNILKAGRHLLALINEVLDISRIESGRLSLNMEAVPLAEVAKEAINLVRPLADQHGVRLEQSFGPDESLFVLADRQRLKQVMLNLLSNAIKYNRPGGRVIISQGEVISGRRRLSFTDCGYGIAPDKLKRLYTPFDRLGAEQSGIEGSGLGLVLTKRLVEAMGGRLGVESEVGRGSTFWIELECAAAAPELAGTLQPSSALAPAAAGRSRLILYVEDNVANINLIRGIMAYRPDVRLIDVMQGSLALDFAGDHRPDLILLDLNLPDLDGEEVLRRLKANPATAPIPVVVISGDAIPAHIERLRAAGAGEYLTKPIDVHQFLEVIDRFLKEN